MAELINNFGAFVGNNVFLSLGIALLAGVVASFSPCMLSTVPLIIGYVGSNEEKGKKEALKYSLIFSLGLVLTFITIGVITAVLGKYISAMGSFVYLIIGVVLLFIGLKYIGIIGAKNEACKMPNRKKGVLGAFFLGILGGVLSSPCSTPILAVILTIVATKGSMMFGIFMLLFYGIGHCLLIIVAGLSAGFIDSLSTSPKYIKLSKILKIVIGTLIIVMALYFIYLGM